jgi:cytochrome o ubiquinol oxidase subunit 2
MYKFFLLLINKSIKACYLPIVFLISSCSSAVVFHPKGAIGVSEKSLILTAASLMLIVVLPAIMMTVTFAWRYRESNKNAKYKPEWAASKKIEIAIWTIPSLIIVILSILVWKASHALDPYRPLKSQVKPLIIEVVSLDWKWLFIYPEQHIATVNTLVIPTDVPIHFFLTSDTVMNSFFIPQLGSQIMTMAGMQTQLNLIANVPGLYNGISSNFSGVGFTGMNFQVIANSENEFYEWVDTIQKNSRKFELNSYSELAKPDIHHTVMYFSSVPTGLFKDIINQHGM